MAQEIGFKETKYLEKNHPLKLNPHTKKAYSPQTITLNPDCVRGIYQRMKKAA